MTRSADRGATFLPPVRVSTAGRNADLPAIAVDANRNVVVAYIDQDPSNNLLVLNAVRSTDGGATFGAVQSLAGENSINPLQPLSLAFDSKGAAYLAWSAATAPFTCRMAVAPAGTTFSIIKTISDSTLNAFAPRVAVDRSDAVYVTFYNRYATTTGLNREVMVQKSTDGGSTFSAPVNVSNNDGQSMFPFLAVDAARRSFRRLAGRQRQRPGRRLLRAFRRRRKDVRRARESVRDSGGLDERRGRRGRLGQPPRHVDR